MSVSLPFVLPLNEAKKTLTKNKALSFVNVANASARGFLVSRIMHDFGFGTLFWASEDEKADVLEPNVKKFFAGNIIHLENHLKAEKFYHFLDCTTAKNKSQTIIIFEDFENQNLALYPSEKAVKASTKKIKQADSLSSFTFFRELEALGYKGAEDKGLQRGEFRKEGDMIFVWGCGDDFVTRIDLFGDEVDGIYEISPKYDLENKKIEDINPKTPSAPFNKGETKPKNLKKPKKLKEIKIKPADLDKIEGKKVKLTDLADARSSVLVYDDLDEEIESGDLPKIKFTSFPKEEEPFIHLNFFSILPYYTIPDWVTDMKERMRRGFEIVIMTKRSEELKALMKTT